MPYYTAEVPEPYEPQTGFLDDLRGPAKAEIVVTIEAENRHAAAIALSEATSLWWSGGAYSIDWFLERLVPLRGKAAAKAKKELTI